MIQEFDDTILTLALVKYAGVTPRMFDELARKFGSPSAMIQADRETLVSKSGVGEEIAERILNITNVLDQAADYTVQLQQRQISIATRWEPTYGKLLSELNDPPPLVYYRGGLPDPTGKSAAIAGADNAGNDGMELTARVAKELAGASVQIVSSLTGGISYAAHLGCKAAEGKSFAILDGGFDDIAPEEGSPLAIDIVASGGLISEYSPEERAGENNYRQSNRIIAGLSQAVILTEFYEDSARALDLISFCGEIGKLAFVIVDEEFGALSDEQSLQKAAADGAIIMTEKNAIEDIIRSLV